MTKTVTAPYDVAEHLRTREDMAAYLEASIEEADGDAAVVARALGDIARARGLAQVASDAGLFPREPLENALRRGCSHVRDGSQGGRRAGADVASGGVSRRPATIRLQGLSFQLTRYSSASSSASKSRRNAASASARPASVSRTDLALVTGSVMSPLR